MFFCTYVYYVEWDYVILSYLTLLLYLIFKIHYFILLFSLTEDSLVWEDTKLPPVEINNITKLFKSLNITYVKRIVRL